MRRPSHWIALLTILMLVAYAVTPKRAQPVSIESRETTQPVVVRRSAGQDPSRQPTGPILGTVLDRLGRPIAAATVSVPPDLLATTAADGSFELQVPGLERMLLRVEALGHRPSSLWSHAHDQVALVLADALPWDPHTEPEPTPPAPDLVGEGFLATKSGAAAPFGIITVAETGSRVAADQNGRFRIPLPDTVATLIAHDRGGHVVRGEPLYATRNRGLIPLPELRLGAGGRLRGYLRDPRGAPCRAAALRLRGQGDARLTHTGDDGGFTFDGLLDGGYVVEALPHDGALGISQRLVLGEDDDLELQLLAPQTIRVHVVEAAAATPVAGVHVVAEESTRRRAHAVTDMDGMATLEGLGEGPWAFDVRAADSFASFDIVRYAAEDGLLTVRAP